MRPSRALYNGIVVPATCILLATQVGASSFEEPDTSTEDCLAGGEILKKKMTLEGVTRPELFLIECDGAERRVVVKQLDEKQRGIKRFEDGTWEMNYSDSYRYERAAYLLDRELGLDMVPVAVIRKVRRREGAVVEWIDEASHLADAPNKPTGPQMTELSRQKAVMRLFDALIYNTDRNVKNYLLDDHTWKLYLIDHSRAFRDASDLPESYYKTTARLSRDLFERLQALDEESLIELMQGSIERGQIETLLERRDKLLEKIESDCEKYGDEVIFSG